MVLMPPGTHLFGDTMDRWRGRLQQYAFEIFLLAGGAVFLLVWMLDLNRNLLYLAMILSAYICGLTVTRTLLGRTGVLIGVTVLLLAVRTEIPLPAYIPLPEGQEVILESSERWQYHFPLYNREAHKKACGILSGYLYVYGHDLEELTITANEVRIDDLSVYAGSDFPIGRTALPVTGQDLMIGLSPKPGEHTSIRQGSEAFGFTLYPDAVFVNLENERCRIIYHAQRSVPNDGDTGQ